MSALQAVPIRPDPTDGGGVGGNAASSPGPGYSWVSSVGGVSTATGNKLTAIPTVSWVARGGLIVDLTLYHNSENNVGSPSRGAKWALLYDTNLRGDAYGNVRVGWGNGNHYDFGNTNGVYSPPPGIHDRLIANGSPIASYDLIRKDQTVWHFAPYGSPGSFSLTSITDARGNAVTMNRASNGGLLGLTDPTGRQVTFGYNSTYYTSITDPKGRVFSFGFDGSGNMSSVTYPVLNGTSYSLSLGYDANHNVTSIQDLRGNTATFSYNAADNSIAWERDNLGNQTTFTYGYDGVRNVSNALATTVTDANSHSTAYWYDNTGRLSAVYDALGNHDFYWFDGGNNLTQKQDRRGFNWNNTYDGMGNLLTAKDPYSNTTTYTYNSHNKPLTTTLPSGRSTAVAYDAYDNPTQVQEKDAGGTVLATTSYAYSYGLVTAKTDTNQHTTQYGYDANGDLNSVTTPLGHQTQWAYDALGFQTSRTDAMGRTTTYTPDAWERLVTTTYPDSTTNAYSYDPNGNLTGFTNYTAAWTRAYDGNNRETSEYIGPTRIVAHSYDASGQKGLLSTTTDTDGRVLSYAYTARNELASVNEAAGTTSYTYDANANQTHLYLPNGLRTDQYYNNDNTLQSYYNWDGGNFTYQSYGYGYNADHQLTWCNEASNYYRNGTPDVTNIAYGYDGQGHLTSDTRTNSYPYAKTYAVDGAGNRQSMNENGAVSALSYDADDELGGVSGAGSYGYTYNGNGDQVSSTINGQQTTYAYDFDDQLVSITGAGSTVMYRYDALGRQVNRSLNGSLTSYSLDGEQMLEEKGPGGTVQYTWGNGLIRRGGEYAMSDGRGTTKVMTSASGAATSFKETEAFGRMIGLTAATLNPYSYQGSVGYRSDGDGPAGSEAYQKVGARYYDPQFGRFLTRDTELGQKPYAYCDGDPVNFSDPSGHQKKKDPKKPKPSDGSSSSEDNKATGEAVTAAGDHVAAGGAVIGGAGYGMGKMGPGAAAAGEVVMGAGIVVTAIGGAMHLIGVGISNNIFGRPGPGTNGVPIGKLPTNFLGQPLMQ